MAGRAPALPPDLRGPVGTGWNLTPGTSTTVKSTINYMLVHSAPEGETFVGYVDEDTALTSHTTTGGLMVSNVATTAPLPNTPVEVVPAPVA